jgi:hypothetical protein
MFRINPLILFAVILVGCNREGSHPADHKKPGGDEHAEHSGDHSMLMLQTEPSPVEVGKPTKLKLMIHDASGAMVKNFDVVHENKVHLIIVRDGLDQFAHVHPAVDATGNDARTRSRPWRVWCLKKGGQREIHAAESQLQEIASHKWEPT